MKNTTQNITSQQEKAAKTKAFPNSRKTPEQLFNRTKESRSLSYARRGHKYSLRRAKFSVRGQLLWDSNRKYPDYKLSVLVTPCKIEPRKRNYIYNNIQPSTGIRGTPSYQSRVNFASQNIQNQKNSLNGEDKLLQTQPIRGTLSSTSYKPWTKLDWWKYHRKKDFRKANEQRKASDRRHEERSQQATVAFQEKMTAKTHLSPEMLERAKAFQAAKKAALQAPIVPPTIAKGNISKFLPTLGFA